MSAQPAPGARFVRKTDLAPNEYRKNFKQIDDDVIEAITSAEADEVTPLMAKIYLRLLKAPTRYWERAGVLRFEAEIRGDERVKAWTVMCELLRASSATVNKALRWMHEQGIIGYFSGKNGVGIRIFLNRAASSVGTRPASEGKKILPFPPASSKETRASSGEAAFKDTYGSSDKLPDIDSRAPKSGAEDDPAGKSAPGTGHLDVSAQAATARREGREEGLGSSTPGSHSVEELIKQLEVALEPSLRNAAARAAALEHERTREWLETRGLPKVARVAQREAFNVLRQCGAINDSARRTRSGLMVGAHNGPSKPGPRPLSSQEIEEAAELCVLMLESRGQSIDVTLADLSAEAGGYLLAEDAPKVRESAESLARRIIQKE